MEWLLKLGLRGLVAMGFMQAIQSPENTALVVGYIKTSMAYFGWLLMSTMTA